jgi:hypothetical protein
MTYMYTQLSLESVLTGEAVVVLIALKIAHVNDILFSAKFEIFRAV